MYLTGLYMTQTSTHEVYRTLQISKSVDYLSLLLTCLMLIGVTTNRIAVLCELSLKSNGTDQSV